MELAGGNPLSYMVDQGRKLKLKEVKHYDDLVRKYSSVDEIQGCPKKTLVHSFYLCGKSRFAIRP